MIHICPTEVAAIGALITGCAAMLHFATHCKHRVCNFLRGKGGASDNLTVDSNHNQGDRK